MSPEILREREAMRKALGLFLAVALTAGCGGAGVTQPASGGNVVTTGESSKVAEAAKYSPKPGDFSVTALVLKRDCFGSAGCNVQYRINPQYKGQPLSDSQSFTVTYTVKGGSDPQEGNFTLIGGKATYSEMEFIQTSSASAKLTITVTSVISN